jgi:hypothetical protein
MRGVITDLTGKRFGHLLVVGYAPKQGAGSWWRCACDCGKTCAKAGKELTRPGWVHSCGCRTAIARSLKGLPTAADRRRLTTIHVEHK